MLMINQLFPNIINTNIININININNVIQYHIFNDEFNQKIYNVYFEEDKQFLVQNVNTSLHHIYIFSYKNIYINIRSNQAYKNFYITFLFNKEDWNKSTSSLLGTYINNIDLLNICIKQVHKKLINIDYYDLYKYVYKCIALMNKNIFISGDEK